MGKKVKSKSERFFCEICGIFHKSKSRIGKQHSFFKCVEGVFLQNQYVDLEELNLRKIPEIKINKENKTDFSKIARKMAKNIEENERLKKIAMKIAERMKEEKDSSEVGVFSLKIE